jgi:hypothetical protein
MGLPCSRGRRSRRMGLARQTPAWHHTRTGAVKAARSQVALGDHHARLASDEELGRHFAGYQLGACHCWGLAGQGGVHRPRGARARHRGVRGGTQTESVRMRARELFGSSRSPPCRWSSGRTEAATTRSVGGERRSRIWQAAGTQRRNGLRFGGTPPVPRGLPLTTPVAACPGDWESGYDDGEVASWTVWVSPNFPVSNGSASECLTSPRRSGSTWRNVARHSG